MRKRFLILALVLSLILVGCGGDVRNVSREMDESEIYSPAEIDAAMDIVIRFFADNYDGCKLKTLCYDEEVSAEAAPEWAEQYEAEEAIVLVSSFDVDGSGDSPALNPNSTYNNYRWILTRSGGAWTLQTWGY